MLTLRLWKHALKSTNCHLTEESAAAFPAPAGLRMEPKVLDGLGPWGEVLVPEVLSEHSYSCAWLQKGLC